MRCTFLFLYLSILGVCDLPFGVQLAIIIVVAVPLCVCADCFFLSIYEASLCLSLCLSSKWLYSPDPCWSMSFLACGGVANSPVKLERRTVLPGWSSEVGDRCLWKHPRFPSHRVWLRGESRDSAPRAEGTGDLSLSEAGRSLTEPDRDCRSSPRSAIGSNRGV